MATFDWQVYADTPAWMSVGANTIVFSGSKTDLTVPITVGSDWNSGTHLGNGDPGADQCGGTHVPNVEYVSSTQFKLDGGSTETLNNTNLAATECSLAVEFTDGSSVAITNARFYCFNSTTETTRATGVEVYAFEAQQAQTAWELINDDSASIGGDQGYGTTHVLDLQNQGAATQHTFYLAVSARPESVGAKGDFDFGVALTYS